MKTDLIHVRPADFNDCEDLTAIHETAWMSAYRGVLDGIELQKIVQQRSYAWWIGALNRGVQINILEVSGVAAGYATYGSARSPSARRVGEIYELYLKPEYQGLGFGRTLFEATRQSLAQQGLIDITVQVLQDNTPAINFYEALGGKRISSSSYQSGQRKLELATLGWPKPDNSPSSDL
ncbi:MAG: GNAT family N-acetyltransferase [Rhodobacteraceae bacterium]|nr:GNAT family N-acetyltransferase [Paracoccaceae bacterium]